VHPFWEILRCQIWCSQSSGYEDSTFQHLLMFMPHAKSSVIEEATTVITTTTTLFYNAKVKSLHTVKAYRQNRAGTPHILHCNSRWRWVASCFTSRQRTHGVHWLWGWVGPRTSLNVSGGEINLLLLPGIKHESLICSQVTILTTLSELHCIL